MSRHVFSKLTQSQTRGQVPRGLKSKKETSGLLKQSWGKCGQEFVLTTQQRLPRLQGRHTFCPWGRNFWWQPLSQATVLAWGCSPTMIWYKPVWAEPCIGDWEGWLWTACWERPLHESKIRLSTNFLLPEVCLSKHHHFVRKPSLPWDDKPLPWSPPPFSLWHNAHPNPSCSCHIQELEENVLARPRSTKVGHSMPCLWAWLRHHGALQGTRTKSVGSCFHYLLFRSSKGALASNCRVPILGGIAQSHYH